MAYSAHHYVDVAHNQSVGLLLQRYSQRGIEALSSLRVAVLVEWPVDHRTLGAVDAGLPPPGARRPRPHPRQSERDALGRSLVRKQAGLGKREVQSIWAWTFLETLSGETSHGGDPALQSLLPSIQAKTCCGGCPLRLSYEGLLCGISSLGFFPFGLSASLALSGRMIWVDGRTRSCILRGHRPQPTSPTLSEPLAGQMKMM